MDSLEFIYIHNKSRHKFSGKTVGDIMFKVATFLTHRGEEPDLEKIKALIENQLKTVAPGRKKTPTLTEAFHAGMALLRQASGKTVDQNEVDRRTQICLNCPVRSQTSFCKACGGLSRATGFLEKIRQATRNTVTVDKKVKADFCGVCGCSLPLLLITDKEHLPEDGIQEKKLRPDHCWIKK